MAQHSESDMILILGLPRTGTQIYHMSEVPNNPTHYPMWSGLIERKIKHPDTLLTAVDFEPMLKDYPGGNSDVPSAIFGIDLIHAYPKAKVLITERDEDAWVDSMKRTLVLAHREEQARREDKLKTGTQSELEEQKYKLRMGYHTWLWNDDFETHGRAYWRKFQKEIREAAKAHRTEGDVLVFNPKDGWGPLCEFLGKPVPSDIGFPHEGNKSVWSTKDKEHNSSEKK
ncbi:hypothetical protein LEL_06948 [Akanthomyces lecanii RCEF 1005]|uniref:NAD dependent epimerase/dehydratase n=1 Tax=Akanthomyces lecanii RCEF 1005 TaxID=1081108 RepID=A0A168FC36_CORDF|nr:hypothetical protein LEL_06948 [Akanthomyces lecanii RCEF 1005]